jgi:hypothetical protein
VGTEFLYPTCRRLRPAFSLLNQEFRAGSSFRHAQAYTRLAASRDLVEQGRRPEADEQLQRALAFYRAVNASRYVREGEALLAASA